MYKLKPIEWTSIEVYKDDDADQYWVPQGDVPIHIKRVNGVYILVKYWCDCDAEPYDNFEEAAAVANREIESELMPYIEYVAADTSELAMLRSVNGHMQKEIDALRSREMNIDDIADYTESIQRLKAENEQLKQAVEMLRNPPDQIVIPPCNHCGGHCPPEQCFSSLTIDHRKAKTNANT